MKYLLLLLLGLASSAFAQRNQAGAVVAPSRNADKTITVPTSAYCSCRYCCGWYYDKAGVPRVRGTHKRKKIGQTASGKIARHGTVAVDPRVYPRGTVFYVPGYGYAVAEDRGGAVKGPALELWFASHTCALQWGRRRKEVRVWYPNRGTP